MGGAHAASVTHGPPSLSLVANFKNAIPKECVGQNPTIALWKCTKLSAPHAVKIIIPEAYRHDLLKCNRQRVQWKLPDYSPNQRAKSKHHIHLHSRCNPNGAHAHIKATNWSNRLVKQAIRNQAIKAANPKWAAKHLIEKKMRRNRLRRTHACDATLARSQKVSG